MEMKLIVFNDLHLADKPPIGRKPGYCEEGLDMLRELVQLANDSHSMLCTTGDLFHVKRPQSVSHWLVSQVIDILDDLDGILWVVPGNHDQGTAGADLRHQPLNVLFKCGYANDATGLIRSNGCYIVGRAYNIERDADPTYYALTEEERKRITIDQPVVMLAHGSIIPDGQERPFPHVKVSEIPSEGIDVLVGGHIHEDLGMQRMEGGGYFYNPGSLGRVARTQANRTRTVQALQLEGLNAWTPPLQSALPAEDIFVDAGELLLKPDATEIERFVASLADGLDLETVDVLSLVKAAGLPPDVEARVLRYLEEAQ